jgi:hypothetical protein
VKNVLASRFFCSLPVVVSGSAPEMLKLVGKDLMEGVMTVVANWGAKGQEKLIAEFKNRTGEPWMTQDSISTYGDIWIFKDALEHAKGRAPQVRGQRPPLRRGAADRAVAERRAEGGLPAGLGAGEAGVVEAIRRIIPPKK